MNTVQDLQRIDTGRLKRFAQTARRKLREQVGAQLDRVLENDSAELREKETAVKDLKKQIEISSREVVIDRVAYTWFNRFCALRFMDVNQYTRIGTVSPAHGFTQPEMLAEAKQGHIDDSLKSFVNAQRVFDILGGRIPSNDAQQEAYRLLIVAVCNYYNAIMPFLFEKIADYTELLMPDDLLSDSSILAETRNTLTPDACEDVEIIGWLYQFYISEKKEEVFDSLKNGVKISVENIPAATQLFTPNWIVRYLVENSLGRLWMLNKPTSRLLERMSYYIKPKHEETDFLLLDKPEQIKICDPACGSGHMLVYAFDLLYAIYEEQGCEPAEIPRLILQNNLYGIEIDERAAELAAFALVMKARKKSKRFFNNPIQPNICVLEKIEFQEGELTSYLDAVGHDLFTDNLRKTLHQFRESDNYGSLIQPATTDVVTLLDLLQQKEVAQNLFLHHIHERVLRVLKYVEYLSPRYHVVVANPPYLSDKGMNPKLKTFADKNYPVSKSDLFSMFIDRSFSLTMSKGYSALVTMQSWMFLSSYENLRDEILKSHHISTLVQIGYNSFPELNSKVAQACAFVLENGFKKSFGYFLNLNDAPQAADKQMVFLQRINTEAIQARKQEDFRRIPNTPIAYWITDSVLSAFNNSTPLSSLAEPRQGCATSDNKRFLRFWFEVDSDTISYHCGSLEEALESNKRWFPYNKGGTFRKWYGNQEYVINWENDGAQIKAEVARKYPYLNGNIDYVVKNRNYYFRDCLSWSKVTSSGFCLRYFPPGFIFDVSGCSIFIDDDRYKKIIFGCMNSPIVASILNALSPTLNFEVGQVAQFPIINDFLGKTSKAEDLITEITDIAKDDWDSYETSWGFEQSPLLSSEHQESSFAATYGRLRKYWQTITLKMQSLERESNEIFIDAYSLQHELSPNVALSDVTLTCNPKFRYGKEKKEEELESLLLADTVKDFISYVVGCMFGRYSIDKPGLILSRQGETKQDYLNQIPNPKFPLDDDNVIPVLDGDWFNDDISERFRKFLRTTFGDKHYESNLQFIEAALSKDIRKYFLKDFYNDHIKRYRKRPIYWLFSSPKGTFNALIYMHRYRPDTISIVLNDYLREFRTKLSSRKSHLEAITISVNVSPGEKTKALKEIESLKKSIDELDTYERETLYPLATQKIQIDLNDGVPVNYIKLGKALKSIPGMASEED